MCSLCTNIYIYIFVCKEHIFSFYFSKFYSTCDLIHFIPIFKVCSRTIDSHWRRVYHKVYGTEHFSTG